MTKHEFLLQATLSGFVGMAHQTDRISGEYIVQQAKDAWARLEFVRLSDEACAQVVAGELEVKS